MIKGLGSPNGLEPDGKKKWNPKNRLFCNLPQIPYPMSSPLDQYYCFPLSRNALFRANHQKQKYFDSKGEKNFPEFKKVLMRTAIGANGSMLKPFSYALVHENEISLQEKSFQKSKK